MKPSIAAFWGINTAAYPAVFLLALATLCSCKTSGNLVNRLRIESGYCEPPLTYSYDSSSMPRVLAGIPDSLLLKKYSYRSLVVANAVGILSYLKELQSESLHSSAYVRKKQKIDLQLLLISTEISSVASELDCESERAQQVANFVLEKENRRVRRLTIFSITVGAATGVASAVAGSHGTAQAVAITGGIVGAGLGLSALFSSRRVLFNHHRNLLADIWNEESSSGVFPPAIWFMLTEKFFSNEQQESVARNMKQRWINYEELDSGNRKSKRLKELFFGTGGFYSDDELRSRARMLNQVQAAVKLMNQDLQELIAEISRQDR